MDRFSMTDLIKRTLKSDQEFNELQFAGLSIFLATVARLEQDGLSQQQLQMLVECPFSRFGRRECGETLVLALALVRGTATVAEWHEVLRNRMVWARMHGCVPWLPTETLPDREAIDAELGLPPRGVAGTPPVRPRIPVRLAITHGGE